ncbi:TolB family protein [Symbiobacterium thermophilum]|uniref:Uncharacterized protein n=1 Tax=Symbiobacterium thermophilum (strain DSM 24528 / JCM 14929 / IAM 14863 / T) TaxID=292459 RepID=Q67NP9_SYMTH|nr:PD40 domain-containing protein [Symbiobacterium thermophilum]BAD40694.1 conserved hypothetical protein [Symbiobacterium thermophilum IAM 14863]
MRMSHSVRVPGGGAAHAFLLLVGLSLLVGAILRSAPGALPGSSVPASAGPEGEGRPEAEWAARLTPLTQTAAMDGFAVWSPDGREIAFMRDGQILLTTPQGRPVRVLTTQPGAWDAGPVWRPDGRALAFVRLSTRDGGAQVMLLPVPPGNAPDGKPVALTSEPGAIGYLAWDHSGDRLYYTTNDRIVRIAVPSGRKEEIFRAPEGWELISGGLAVAQDGRWLLFGGGPRTGTGVEYELYRLPLEGGEPERLTSGGGIMPGLHPGGRLVAYRNPRATTGIYVLDLATKEARRVLPDDARAMFFHPHFSPDGTKLLVSRLRLAPAQQRARGGFTSNIYVFEWE